MRLCLQDHLQRCADLLFAGRSEELSREFLYPAALYLDDRLVVIDGAAALIDLVQTLRQTFLLRGVHRCLLTVTAIELPKAGRFRVWMQWEERAHVAARSRWSNVICYVRVTSDGNRSEMIEVRAPADAEPRHCPPPRRLA